MKRNIYTCIFLVFTHSFLFQSCTKDFEEINTDPNRIEKISPGTLLNPILYSLGSFYTSRSNDFTFGVMQVNLPFPSVSGGVHRYDISEAAGNSTWTTSYRWLTNIREMYEASVAAEDPNYQAIALTLNAWVYSNLTDAFGDVPMTEASRAEEGILRPAFNTQKEVYTKILSDLETANSLFDPSRPMIYGNDILFNNNIQNWKRFTNSLRMRLLLRIIKREEMNSLALLQEMIDNPATYPVFNSNDQGAVLKVTGITPNVSPWGRAIDFTTFRAASKFFIDNLNEFNDPRLPKFATQARTADGVTTIGYRGIPSGFSNDSQFDFLPSNLNIALVTAPMNLVILPYAEVEFIKSEVEYRRAKMAESKTAYDKGVKASIEQWGAVMPADYLSNEKASFNETLERIILQKYYALFFVDYQQWFEYRRTGLPVLPKGEGMLNNGIMPVRFRYPVAVQTNNNDNYNRAVENMGGDNINIKVWWEK